MKLCQNMFGSEHNHEGQAASSDCERDRCAQGSWQRIDSDMSRHVWRNRAGKPLVVDKPVDQKWLNMPV